jgi:uncharacterized protein DUF6932
LSSFQNSTTRAQLILGLQRFLNALRKIGIPFEVWIDGSFTTNKENPNDVDLVAFASTADVNSLDPVKQHRLAGLFERITTRHSFGCDVLFSVAEDQNLRSYWRGWYGFDREEQPKGIARIMVLP